MSGLTGLVVDESGDRNVEKVDSCAVESADMAVVCVWVGKSDWWVELERVSHEAPGSG